MPANNAVIGALRVILGADTVAFDKGLKDAEKTLAKFSAGMAKAGAAIGAGVAAAAVGLGVAIKKAIDEADKLGKLSQSIGIPVEQLSALKLAADLSGVSIEEVGKGVGRLSRAMSEIAGGATNSASNAFKALGINVTDSNGKLKSSTQVMEEVADKFAKMEDGAGKTALAITIFGRSGASLIPLLNAGAKGLRETREEAEALGLIVDSRTSKAAEAFNDNLTRLNRVMNGVALRIAAELAPSLAVLTEEIVKFVKEGNVVRNVSEGIIDFFLGIATAAQQVSVTFNRIGVEALALGNVVLSALTLQIGRTVAAFEKFRQEGAETDRQFAEIRNNADALRTRMHEIGSAFDSGATNVKKFQAPIIATKSAIDEFIKSQQKAIATQQADAMAIGLSAGARERLRLVMQAETIARENNIRLTAAQQIQITALANAMQQAVLQQQGYNLLLEAAAPHEKFRLEMANNQAALTAVGATAEQVATVMKMTAEKFGATWEQSLAGAAGGFSQLFNELGKKNAEFATLGKALAIVEATINTYVGFTKALAATPPPFNYIAAAGVLAAGLAKVAAIKSQSIPKMATGGQLIPGAFSGRDSVLMQARVRPDERVEVLRPGEGADDRRGGRGFTSITMQLPSGAAGRFIEDLISDINRKVADGYRLTTSPA